MASPRMGWVLLDAEPGDDADFDRRLLERFDHPVEVCQGPEEGALCPLLGGSGCEKFDKAHGVVFKLDLDRPQHRAIVDRYRELAAEDMPIRVLCTPEQAARYADVLAGVEVWEHEPTVADLDGFAAEVEAFDRLG
jgi:hypothetical protein